MDNQDRRREIARNWARENRDTVRVRRFLKRHPEYVGLIKDNDDLNKYYDTKEICVKFSKLCPENKEWLKEFILNLK